MKTNNVLGNILGDNSKNFSMPGWYPKTLMWYNEFRNKVQKKFNISKIKAHNIIGKASEYDPKNEDDAFKIIGKLLKKD